MKSNHRSHTQFRMMLFCMLIIACDSDNLTQPENMDVLDKGFPVGKPRFLTQPAMRSRRPRQIFRVTG